MINNGKNNRERFIGKITLVQGGKNLPAIFLMQYQNGRLSCVTETPSCEGIKTISSVDRLVELLGGWRIQQTEGAGETTRRASNSRP